MDEATASIDEMTDRLIQNMIKKELVNVKNRIHSEIKEIVISIVHLN